MADGRDGYLAERRAEGLPGLAPGREGKREGLKVGTILSKIVPEVASFPTRNLSKPFEKIVPQLFLTPRVKRYCVKKVLPFAGSEPAGGIYIPTVVRTGNSYSVGTPRTRLPCQNSCRGLGGRTLPPYE